MLYPIAVHKLPYYMVMEKEFSRMGGDMRLSPILVQGWDETTSLNPGLTLIFGFSWVMCQLT